MNQHRINRLVRRQQIRTALRTLPAWRGVVGWRRHAISELFYNCPEAKPRLQKGGRYRDATKEDLRWHLNWLKGKRLGYEVEAC